MTPHPRQQARRRALTLPVATVLLASSLAVGAGFGTPAAADPGDSLPDLATALSACAAPPVEVQLTTDLVGTAQQLTVACDAEIDLNGHDLTVHNVIITTGTTLEVTDTSTTGDPGRLVADATTSDEVPGIKNTGATFTTGGRARVTATGGDQAAGIGGTLAGPGGETMSYDYSQITATGGDYGAGIGGGMSGDGGKTTSNDNSTITAFGDQSSAAIGGGTDGDAGVTTSNDDSSIVATGGDSGAGIGGGNGGAGGTTTGNDRSSITATGGRSAAGIGGGSDGAGGTTTGNDRSTITATGGYSASGIGGGLNGNGGTTTVVGGTVTAVAGSPSAVPIGPGIAGSTYAKLTVSGGMLRLPSHTQPVPADSTIAAPLFEIGAGARVTGGDSSSATITGPGVLVNNGALTLPTANVSPTLVSDHHYRVSFDLNGGAGTAPAPVTVYADTFAHGDRVLPTPSRSGYSFAGWNTAADGSGTPISATSALPGSSADGNAVSLTAYARWVPVQISVPTPTVANTTAGDRGTEHPRVGDRLAAAMPSAAFTYSWRRVTDDQAANVGTASDYTLTAADLGSRIVLTASAAAYPYVGSADSARTGVVEPGVIDDPQLAIDGIAMAEETLTAAHTPPMIEGLAATWQWHTQASGSTEWTPVPDATTETWMPTRGQVGDTVRVTLTLSAPGYTPRTDTATVGPVADLPEVPGTTQPTIEGHPRVGKVLRLVTTPADVPDLATTYQWQRATKDHRTRVWTDIRRATHVTYTPRARDLRHRLRVVLTSEAPGHRPTTSTTRATKRVVRGVLSRPTAHIAIRGGRDLGDTVRITRLRAYRAEIPTHARFHYAWYAGGTRLPHTDRPTYTVNRIAVGKRLRAEITVRAPGYRARHLSVSSAR